MRARLVRVAKRVPRAYLQFIHTRSDASNGPTGFQGSDRRRPTSDLRDGDFVKLPLFTDELDLSAAVCSRERRVVGGVVPHGREVTDRRIRRTRSGLLACLLPRFHVRLELQLTSLAARAGVDLPREGLVWATMADDKVVWILGAGFCVPLGGPLFKDLISRPMVDRLRSWKGYRVDRAVGGHQEPRKYGEVHR